MYDLAANWDHLARMGFCTMNIPLCRWAVARAGPELQAHAKDKLILRLPTMAEAFRVPNWEALVSKHHDPGVDAELGALVYAMAMQDARATAAT